MTSENQSCFCDLSNEYVSFDRKYSGHNRISIDGTITGCGNCVGYCKYHAHPGFLTKLQRDEHDCLGKGCFYYLAKPKHEKRRMNKQRGITDTILQAAKALTVDMEGMKVLSVGLANNGTCDVRFVTISNCYPIDMLENRLRQVSGISVKMRKIECDYERSAAIIFS